METLNKYERITTDIGSICDNCGGIGCCRGDCYVRMVEKRLIELENQIENGELIFKDIVDSSPEKYYNYYNNNGDWEWDNGV